MKVHLIAVFSAALLVLNGSHLSAQTINPSSDDVTIINTNYGQPGNVASYGDPADYAARIGEYYAPGGQAYLMPFQLPTLGVGESFTSATLQVQLFDKGNEGGLGNADLYGISISGTPVTSVSSIPPLSYYYQGTGDSSNTLLQSGFLTPSTPVRIDPNTGFVTTDTSGDAALLNFLNLAYAGGANAGDYVFLRVNYDVSPILAGNNFYTLLTEDAGGPNEKPTIFYTSGIVSVPEPSTYAMIGAGLAVLFVIRRRRAF